MRHRAVDSLLPACRRVPAILALGFGVWFPDAARAGPITFNTALPVAQGQSILRGQTKLLRSSDDPDPANRDLTVWAAPTVIAHGVDERLAVFGTAPYLDKTLEVDTPRGRIERGDAGLGDARFFARYTVWQKNRRGATLRLAPFSGIEVPSGDHEARDALGALPRPLQLGSGSWDPFVGAIFTWQTFDQEFDTSVAYQRNTEADGYAFGDEATWNLSYQHRIWPRKLGGGVPGFLYAVAESNLSWSDEDEASGRAVSGTGGTTWRLTPGLQYVAKRFVLETAIQLPVVQNLDGGALENDFILTAGFRVNF